MIEPADASTPDEDIAPPTDLDSLDELVDTELDSITGGDIGRGQRLIEL